MEEKEKMHKTSFFFLLLLSAKFLNKQILGYHLVPGGIFPLLEGSSECCLKSERFKTKEAGRVFCLFFLLFPFIYFAFTVKIYGFL